MSVCHAVKLLDNKIYHFHTREVRVVGGLQHTAMAMVAVVAQHNRFGGVTRDAEVLFEKRVDIAVGVQCACNDTFPSNIVLLFDEELRIYMKLMRTLYNRASARFPEYPFQGTVSWAMLRGEVRGDEQGLFGTCVSDGPLETTGIGERAFGVGFMIGLLPHAINAQVLSRF